MFNILRSVGELFASVLAVLFAFIILLASFMTLGLCMTFAVIMQNLPYVLVAVLLIIVGKQMGYL